jgi:hypothetical protein
MLKQTDEIVVPFTRPESVRNPSGHKVIGITFENHKKVIGRIDGTFPSSPYTA